MANAGLEADTLASARLVKAEARCGHAPALCACISQCSILLTSLVAVPATGAVVSARLLEMPVGCTCDGCAAIGALLLGSSCGQLAATASIVIGMALKCTDVGALAPPQVPRQCCRRNWAKMFCYSLALALGLGSAGAVVAAFILLAGVQGDWDCDTASTPPARELVLLVLVLQAALLLIAIPLELLRCRLCGSWAESHRAGHGFGSSQRSELASFVQVAAAAQTGDMLFTTRRDVGTGCLRCVTGEIDHVGLLVRLDAASLARVERAHRRVHGDVKPDWPALLSEGETVVMYLDSNHNDGVEYQPLCRCECGCGARL